MSVMSDPFPIPDDADGPLMVGRACEFCNLPATHTNSVTDINARGANFHEPGYCLQYLCWLHAREAEKENTSRVRPLTEEDAAP